LASRLIVRMSVETKVIFIGLAVVLGVGLYRLVQHIRRVVPRPDPWDADIEQAVNGDDAIPICHRCLTEHDVNAWFCPKCGAAVGEYNNLLPFVQVFSEGEVLRNSLFDRLRITPLTVAGFFVFTASLAVLTGIGIVLAPIYWALFIKNVQRNRIAAEAEKVSNENQSPL
jgi:hypothetical protein